MVLTGDGRKRGASSANFCISERPTRATKRASRRRGAALPGPGAADGWKSRELFSAIAGGHEQMRTGALSLTVVGLGPTSPAQTWTMAGNRKKRAPLAASPCTENFTRNLLQFDSHRLHNHATDLYLFSSSTRRSVAMNGLARRERALAGLLLWRSAGGRGWAAARARSQTGCIFRPPR
jgi:hypothetical protein